MISEIPGSIEWVKIKYLKVSKIDNQKKLFKGEAQTWRKLSSKLSENPPKSAISKTLGPKTYRTGFVFKLGRRSIQSVQTLQNEKAAYEKFQRERSKNKLWLSWAKLSLSQVI